MRVAALDLGTNTFLLLIADIENGQMIKVIHDQVAVVRLGQGVHQSRRFHPEALARAEDCFSSYSDTIRKHNVDRILACATSAARDVTNAQELIDMASSHGIPLEIISGVQEAEYTFWGTVENDLKQPVVIIDVGGGSTEFILGGPSGITQRQSLDLGSVRMTEMFVSAHPIGAEELSRMSSYIRDQLKTLDQGFLKNESIKLIAVAGTPTTLATLDQGLPFETDRVNGYRLPISKIGEQVHALAALTVLDRQKLAGMEPKRADVIVAGALILWLSCQIFNASELEVSIRGLRYGLAKKLGSQ